MRIRNEGQPLQLTPFLLEELREIRRQRAFDARNVLEAKALLLNAYVKRYGLKAVVIAVSGGIDSAVVLGIAHYASLQPDSPIERIVPVLLPVSNTEGATGQFEATVRGHEVCQFFGLKICLYDMHSALDTMTKNVSSQMKINNSPWADGQLVSTLRTPVLYYITSLLLDSGYPAILLGTTNRDEGAYIGYFGKASDGMTDVQIVSDLHKSEVRLLASYMNIPDSVQNVTPTGDMWDASPDEQVFGVSYDAIELNTALKVRDAEEGFRRGNNGDFLTEWKPFEDCIERFHNHNAHKYMGRSPAVHLDVMPAWIPKGWDNRYAFPYTPRHQMPEGAVAPYSGISEGYIKPSSINFQHHELESGTVMHFTGNAFQSLGNAIPIDGWSPTGDNGRAGGFLRTVSSWRRTTWEPALASIIWKAIRSYIPALKILDETAVVEHEGHRVWRAMAVSPLMRFIRYPEGGMLLPHYDAPYKVDQYRTTLMSLVIFIGGNGASPTQFLNNGAEDAPSYEDRTEMVLPEISILQIPFESGNAVAFDHRMLHQSSPGGAKFILRTDIIFERLGWPEV